MQQLDRALAHLLAPEGMHNLQRLGTSSPTPSMSGRQLLIVADYDSDGATACAVGMLALQQMGAQRRLPGTQSLRVRLRIDTGDRTHRS
jgi:single-stranded-DNA-specific exonuclease